MPLQVQDDTPKTFPKPDFLTFQNFKRGVITLINESRLPKNALKEGKNIYLYEDGQPGDRPGVDWYGVASPNGSAIDGFDYFDSNGSVHLVMVAGGTVYRSTNDGDTWTACTGATLTAGEWTSMNQNDSFLYLTNGTDDIVRYDGTTTLQTYGTLTGPSAPTTAKTGLGATTYTYYYKISAVNQIGFTAASTSGTIQVSLTRDGWDATSNYVTLTGTVDTDATRVDIYLSEDDDNYYYLDSAVTIAGAFTYKDDGSAQVVSSTLAPVDDTSTGPKVKELVNVGTRQIGVRDPNNPYRIWYTGPAPTSGAFAGAFGGGYLDWRPGGKLKPVQAADYRSGKGDPIATIWCDSADGLGGIIQLSFDEVTIDNITIIEPSAFLLPGSRGTPAPGSVINVLNDYYFYNSQAFYNLGSRAQFLNILSTDEASANIRPNVKQISRSGEADICAVYYDANILFSVPIASSTNNFTMLYNTELKAWLPEAFTIGFNKFLRYTDTNRVQHLLALKPGDTRLSEISSDFEGDYGVAFETSLTTGLYSTTRDPFEFQFVEEAEFELAQVQSTVYVELLGITRPSGLQSIKTVALTVSSSVAGQGWDTFDWDTTNWDDTSNAPTTISESSTKRYFTVQKELNAVQWHIYTTNIDSKYTHRTFQTWGTATQAAHPSTWRLNSI